ncbi:MAG: UDP-glucose--hexose-1-phosphate uridylyltransferase [Fusobacteria bacterium]|nr:UDP-glucose--hexose-1-phosphate uridylyltransferase [Fusobacteriota bacterium]
MIEKIISSLLSYGLDKGLFHKRDVIYVKNAYIELFKLKECEVILEKNSYEYSDDILQEAWEYAQNNNLESSIGETKDIACTKIMSVMLPFPSVVETAFYQMEKAHGIKSALNHYYHLSIASNYIKMRDILKNIGWKSETEYGNLEITINLSKPEKDPKEIAKALTATNSSYPLCLLCTENEGFSGDFNKPARQNHRIIELELLGELWYFQYSPYVYYQEHSIVLSGRHKPMVISELTFRKLFAFLERVPHYMVGSNADLPIVGGSILSHEHFQAGNYEFPMFRAEKIAEYSNNSHPNLRITLLKWPMSVIRLIGCKESCIQLGSEILAAWRNYSDKEMQILSHTGETPHNTITPILRRLETGEYSFDLVLRNNRQTAEHPLGLFHPHSEHHHIKKENIGLIEVMGLAILPGRLENEVGEIENLLNYPEKMPSEALFAHGEWILYLKKNYTKIESSKAFVQAEIGKKFLKVLENCGVFPQTQLGAIHFDKFLKTLNLERIHK